MLRNGRRSRSIILGARALTLAALAAGCGGTLSGLEYISQLGPLDSSPNKLVFVPCRAGTKVTGGGAYVFPQINQLAVIRSEPGGG